MSKGTMKKNSAGANNKERVRTRKISGQGLVDIAEKDVTLRRAVAEATVNFSCRCFQSLMRDGSPKGNIFEAAKVAGIMAAKNTAQILPFCHPLMLSLAQIRFEVLEENHAIKVTALVEARSRTGVEMEGLCAVSAAALCVYDMTKVFDKGTVISAIKLLEKSGGKSGDYKRESA